MNQRINNLIANLKIVSKIPENEKLSTSHDLLKIEKRGWATSFNRWLHGNSRTKTIRRITRIINDAILIANQCQLNAQRLGNNSIRRTTPGLSSAGASISDETIKRTNSDRILTALSNLNVGLMMKTKSTDESNTVGEDNEDEALSDSTVILDECQEHLSEMSYEDNISLLDKIKQELIGARGGIENLKMTYRHDVTIRAQLEVVVERICDVVGAIEEKFRTGL